MNHPLTISYRRYPEVAKPINPKQRESSNLSTVKHRLLDRKLIISTKTGYQFLPKDQILALSADGNYTHIHHSDGNTFLVSKTMKTFTDKLDDRFYKIHNSVIVNLAFIAEIHKSESFVRMDNGDTYPIARSRKGAFLELWKEGV